MGARAEAEAGDMTDSTTNSEQLIFEPNRLEEKADSKYDTPEHVADGDEPVYETGWRLWAVMCTIFLTTLLAALDIGIVATAIPGITDDFHKLNDVGWYGGACFLLVGTTSPVWGKMYKYLSARWVYLASILLFLLGSIVAATAPNSTALIVPRAIQGWGCSGSMGGSALMINYVAHPRQQPMLLGLWMSVFMSSTIIGPLIGGVFTTDVTWRWCFWINLPVGGPVVAMVLLFFHVPKHIKTPQATWKEILLQLDLPGFSLLLTSLVCLILALQWGGQTKTWSDGSVVATLVMWVVLTIAFVVTEWLQGHRAIVPLSLLRLRMAWTNALSAFIGILVGKTRIFHPYMLMGGLLATAGGALLYTLEVDSSKARYIGPQVLVGFGNGLGCQVPMMALQSFTKPENMASITGIILMCNSISGAYFLTAAQSIFANRLLKTLASNAPNIDAAKVLSTGASELHRVFGGADLAHVRNAYMVGIKAVFALAIAGAAFTAVLTLAVPLKKMPSHEKVEEEGTIAKA